MPGFEWLGEEEKAAVMDVMERKVLFRYDMGGQLEDIYCGARLRGEPSPPFTGAQLRLAR